MSYFKRISLIALKNMKLALFIMFIQIFLINHIQNIAYAEGKLTYTVVEDGVSKIISVDPIRLFVNGKEILNLETIPVIYNDFTLVPAREIFEPLGALIDWNPHTMEVYVAHGSFLMVLQTDNNYANVDGTITEMDIPVKNINDKTMIPIRFVAEALNFDIGWDAENRIVSLNGYLEDPLEEENNINPDNNELPQEKEEPSNNIDNSDNSNEQNNSNNLDTDNSTDNKELARDVSDTQIATANYAQTNIKSITIPSSSEAQSFKINASSEISEVQKLLLSDNRLIIDVVNSKMDVSQTTYKLEGNAHCSEIRVGQFQTEPVNITRIVFDLNIATEFSVSLSADRKTISVDFEKNTITGINFWSDGVSDYIEISGEMKPAVSTFVLAAPDRVVIDIPYSNIDVLLEESFKGVYSSAIRSSQFDVNTSRIVVDLLSIPVYSILNEGDKTIIKLSEASYRNISYDSMNKQITIRKDENKSISAASIKETDDYLNLKYIITLPGNFSSFIGEGEYVINDSSVKSINIDNSMGNTRIVINEQKIFAASITEDENHLYIKLVSPKERYSNIVVIDAGHGAHDPGTSGFGMKEKDINLDMTQRLVALIETDPNIKAYATRLTDTYPTRSERAQFANELGDLFISIHNNYYEPNATVKGTEVFYYPHANDSTIGISSEEVAKIIHTNIITKLGTFDRKHKYGNLQVLREANVPAVLCEIGFLSNADDAKNLASDSFRQNTAEALHKGIKDVFEVYKPKR